MAGQPEYACLLAEAAAEAGGSPELDLALAGHAGRSLWAAAFHMALGLARQVRRLPQQRQIDAAARARLARLRDDHAARRLHLLRLCEQVERAAPRRTRWSHRPRLTRRTAPAAAGTVAAGTAAAGTVRRKGPAAVPRRTEQSAPPTWSRPFEGCRSKPGPARPDTFPNRAAAAACPAAAGTGR
eukprot:scaffold47745_cov68-Phaeocystis_antarctica.AAC.8